MGDIKKLNDIYRDKNYNNRKKKLNALGLEKH